MRKTIKQRYETLLKNCEEVSYYIQALRDELEYTSEELRYKTAFISYKQLDEEFCHFRKNAHEEFDDDLPFPTLTL